MNKLFSTLAISAALASPFAAQAATYTVDTKGAHASVNFKVPHLGYSFIVGRFNNFEGSFTYDADNLESSSIEITLDVNSLDSNHAERDKHLRSDDFLDTSKYQSAHFKSTGVTEQDDGSLEVTGELTLHGKTQTITIDADLVGEGNDPWGNYRAGFEGTTRLELADFGIPVMGPSSYVDLELHVEGIRQ